MVRPAGNFVQGKGVKEIMHHRKDKIKKKGRKKNTKCDTIQSLTAVRKKCSNTFSAFHTDNGLASVPKLFPPIKGSVESV